MKRMLMGHLKFVSYIDIQVALGFLKDEFVSHIDIQVALEDILREPF